MQNEDKPGAGKSLSTSSSSYSLPKKVAIIYSEVKREYFPTEDQYITEKDAFRDASIIGKYVKKLGIETILLPGTSDLPERLRQEKPEMVMNFIASVRGLEYLASSIPAMLEFLDIPYTGAGILGESLSYNKFLVKKLLQQNNVPTPNYQLFNTPTDPLDSTLRFPLISKLNEVHGAVEITLDSVSENEKHLRQRLKYLMKTYNQPVLVEEYIVGREITAYLLEGVKKKVYLAEKIFKNPKGKYVFADFESQWLEHGPNIVYQKYDDELVREYVRKAFDVTRMADYGKFDIRLDSSGRFYFLDSNSNPFFGPKEIESPMANILDMYGVSFLDTLKRLISNTMREVGSDY